MRPEALSYPFLGIGVALAFPHNAQVGLQLLVYEAFSY
jgi:hypothetical protein